MESGIDPVASHILCLAGGVLLGAFVYFMIDLNATGDQKRKPDKPPVILDGFVLEPEHVRDFLRNNRGVLTLRDLDRAERLAGEDAAQVRETKAAAATMLAFLAADSPGKEFLFRVVRSRSWTES